MPQIAPTLDTPSIHPTYVRMLCLTLKQHGINIDEILQRAGLPPWSTLAETELYIDQRTLNRLIGTAVDMSGRPWLGIEVGTSIPISAHGPVGYAVIASKNLLQALQTIVRFGVLRNTTLHYRINEETNGMAVTLIERLNLEESRGFMMGVMFAVLIRIMETVVGQPLQRLVIDLPFAEPPWRHEIEKVCNGSLRFNMRQLALHLDHETLSLPCITADSRAYTQACLTCEQELAQENDGTLAQRVRELLGNCQEDYPHLAELAKHFSMSERTFMRRLKEEDSNYQSLLDGVRKDRALWYLRQTRYSIEEIAQRMGYADTSNFSRTFRRWFGITPGDVRRGSSPSSS